MRPRLQRFDGALSIAAINGPAHTLISGQPVALAQLIADCNRDNIHFRPIAVDYASHCAQVRRIREPLLHELAELDPQPARFRCIPRWKAHFRVIRWTPPTMTADYWYRNLREPVRFYDRVAELLAQGSTRLWSSPRIRC